MADPRSRSKQLPRSFPRILRLPARAPRVTVDRNHPSWIRMRAAITATAPYIDPDEHTDAAFRMLASSSLAAPHRRLS